MVKVADIISQVDYVREGWSDAKSPAEWKGVFDEKRKGKLSTEPSSPTREALGKLQDNGLGQKQPALPEVKIVGKA